RLCPGVRNRDVVVPEQRWGHPPQLPLQAPRVLADACFGEHVGDRRESDSAVGSTVGAAIAAGTKTTVHAGVASSGARISNEARAVGELLARTPRQRQRQRAHAVARYSHSIVAGGFDEMS